MASLLALFNSFKKTGKSATLVLSTKGGDVTAKLEVKLINAKSSPSSTTTPSPTLLTPPGCQDSSTTSSISCKENQGKCQGSSASAAPGTALPWRRLHCCSGSSPSSPTSPPPSLSKGGEPPSHVDCGQEGWLPAHLLPVGRGWRSTTSHANF